MPWPTRRGMTQQEAGIANGWRSGLEESIGASLKSRGVPVYFEPFKLPYTRPAKKATYCPDFILPNGIVGEGKGRFVTADRQKHQTIKEQYPALDIRFIFSNSNARISKSSPTTYAMWALKYGFKFASRDIPDAWLDEPVNEASLVIIRKVWGSSCPV